MNNKLLEQTLPIDKFDNSKSKYDKYYSDGDDIYTVQANETNVLLNYLCGDFTTKEVIYNEDTQNFRTCPHRLSICEEGYGYARLCT